MVLVSFLYFIAGIALLIGGAHFLTDYAATLSKKWAISEYTIGVTFIAFFTSLPEILVSTMSGLTNMLDPTTMAANIATGTTIGSNIVNICLVLSFGAIITPVAIKEKHIENQYFLLLLTSVVAVLLIIGLDAYGGFGIFVLLGLYLFYLYRKPHTGPIEEIEKEYYKFFSKTNIFGLFLAISGAMGLFAGSLLTVNGVLGISDAFQIPNFLIALVAISIGTSLPEISASLMASAKKMSDLSLGNIVGSNVFNIVGIAFASFFSPIPIETKIWSSLIFLLMVTTSLLVFSRIGKKISKTEGLILLILYLLFVAYQSL